MNFGNSADQALLALGLWLRQANYQLTTPTPATHAVVNARPESRTAKSLDDVFGWSRPFPRALLPQRAIDLLAEGDALAEDGMLLRSKVRFSTLGEFLLIHSAFPTNASDAVFFGPDTYRFARFLAQVIGKMPPLAGPISDPGAIFDMGCGSGVGGLLVKRLLPHLGTVMLADINPKALHYSWVNTQLAARSAVVYCLGDLFEATPGLASLIIANPPYLLDPQARVYRNGGGILGSGLSARIVREGLPKLKPGGNLILYTGVPIVAGKDSFLETIEPELCASNLTFTYEEIDPDVFGEELQSTPYASVDRIAAVGLVIHKARPP